MMSADLLLAFSEWLDTSGHVIQVDPEKTTHEAIVDQFLDEYADTPVVRHALSQ